MDFQTTEFGLSEIEMLALNIQQESSWISRHACCNVYYKNCVICGVVFYSKSVNTKSCSQRCAHARWYESRKADKCFMEDSRRKSKDWRARNINKINAERKIKAKTTPKMPLHEKLGKRLKTSKYCKGVQYDKSKKLFISKITYQRIMYRLGSYEYLLDAAAARKSAEARILQGLSPK